MKILTRLFTKNKIFVVLMITSLFWILVLESIGIIFKYSEKALWFKNEFERLFFN